MIKLIRSNLKRIMRSKSFWICSAVYLLYGLISSLIVIATGNYIEFPCLNIGLSGSPVTGAIILTILSLIIGSDFKNNTIRNKIIIGHSKTKIYLSNVIAFSICATLLNLVYFFITFPISPNTFLFYLFDIIFGDISFALLIQEMIVTVFYSIFTTTFFVSVYMSIIMNIKSAVGSLICGSVLNIVALIMTSMLYDVTQDWLLSILCFYPTGVNAMIASGVIVFNSLANPILILPITATMIALTAVSTTVGIAIFKRSDIK